MKIRQKSPGKQEQFRQRQAFPWKILLVDDEPDVLKLTKINLKQFNYLGRDLEFIEANSGSEAQEKIESHPDIAVALIDVVMETKEAGLKLIEYIRNEFNNKTIRLIVITGQPGSFSEKSIVEKYDINDFKEKTELTYEKLYTAIRFSLKDFNNILSLEANKRALQHILKVTPYFYDLKSDLLSQKFKWILEQLVHVCRIAHTGMISTIEGLLATVEGQNIHIQASVGDFELNTFNPDRREQIIEICKSIVLDGRSPRGLREGSIVIPLKTTQQIFGFVYLECREALGKNDFELVQILTNQGAAGIDNFRLHYNLEQTHDKTVDMLADISEFYDQTTGKHIYRIQELTRRLATALGLSDEEIVLYTKASRLHDIGKVGIPDSILCKPGRLTPDEYKLMTNHTTIGDHILKRIPAFDISRIVARSHHEKWDGNGYPDGLFGKEIPLIARIVAVVDVFDALASPRPYKEAWPVKDIIPELEAASGAQFDPIVITTFLRILRNGELDDLIHEYEQLHTYELPGDDLLNTILT